MSTYAVRGILYFLSDRRLWRLAVCPALLTLAVAVAVLVLLLVTALEPQADALHRLVGGPEWLEYVAAALLVAVEAFLVSIVYGLVTLEVFRDKIFAQVMIERGHRELVENDERHSSVGRVLTSCCRVSVLLRLGLLVVSLPLNVVPVVGNIVYAWLNGTLLAWEMHLYYFEMKGWDYEQQKQLLDERRMQYATFGMQAMLLEMIPVAGVLFMFTNSVGSALFAASIEKDLAKQDRREHSRWGRGVGSSSGKKDPPLSKTRLVDSDRSNRSDGYVPPYGTAN